jgi:hypothetical protein
MIVKIAYIPNIKVHRLITNEYDTSLNEDLIYRINFSG